MKRWIYLIILLILIAILFAVYFKSSFRPPINNTSTETVPGPSWYKTDLHVHGVVSADAHVDLGILSQAAKTYEYNALFLTDHNQASSFPIDNLTANFMQFNDSYTRWDIETFGLPSSSTNKLVTSPVDTGTNSLHLAIASSAYAESFAYTKRGPNFRAGNITLDVAIYPTQLDTDSSIYISVSIGGDATVKTPHGYTTTDGAINSGKSTILLWQIGNGVVSSSDPNARVITYDLDDPIYGNGAYTLNAWNHYTINITDALTDIPTADQPLDYNALSYPKMAVASNNGSAEAYFDTYTIQAPGETPAAEYIYRTSLISTYDTATFKIFPSIEMGVDEHVNRFNFGIKAASEFVDYYKGIEGIPTTQATGYPAQLNHPAQPGGVTYAEAVDNQAFNAEIMEVRREVHIDLWDDILMQDVQVLGAANTDSHAASYSDGSNATYIYSSALNFDLLLRSMYEGRTYSAQSFTGPMIFNLDSSSSEPYPARYPVFVSDAQATANISVSIPTGTSSGYTMQWISEDTLVATDTLTGPSFDKTRAISLADSSTYVRTELRSSSGSWRGLSQPIFFVDVTGLPTDKNIHVEGVTTSNGQGYIKDNVQGITAVSWDESNPSQREMTLTLSNPSGSLIEMRGSSGDEPIGVEVDSSQINPESSLNDFNSATGTAWFYDNPTQTIYLKILHSVVAASALITFGPPDITPPTAPTNLTTTIINPNQVDLSWTASTDNVFVTGYEVSRDNSLLEVVRNVSSYSDNSVQAATNYDYEVRAIDTSDNLSSFSNVAQTTTPPVTSLTFNPIHDANVEEDNPNINYGSLAQIEVDNSPVKHTLMTFNVAGTNQIFKATLRLYNVNASSKGGDFYQIINPSWDENTVTWNNAPSEEPTLLASLDKVEPNNWYEVDVTSIVTGNGLVGIKMISTADNGADYSSKEGAAGFAPELVVLFEGTGADKPPANENQSITTSTDPASASSNTATSNVTVDPSSVSNNIEREEADLGNEEANIYQQQPTGLKVAFIGDQGINKNAKAVLQLIKSQGAHMVLHQGDLGYTESDPDTPANWDKQINDILGDEFPYFASPGNHDIINDNHWRDYHIKLKERLDRIPEASCSGGLEGIDSDDVIAPSACSYKGLFFILSGIDTMGKANPDGAPTPHENEQVNFIKNSLANDNSPWRICSWHKTQAPMQAGEKVKNETGWGVYEACRAGGAMVVTGHNHVYSRTHLMSNFENQTIASRDNLLILEKGKSFVVVSGLGGINVRHEVLLPPPPGHRGEWWASVYTSNQNATYGALFCTFYVNGQHDKADCYFEDINGKRPDEFTLMSKVQASETQTVMSNIQASGTQTVVSRVSASSDDAEEKSSGNVNIDSSDLELVFDGSNQEVGMRFTDINIPQGATITNAYIQFTVDETENIESSLTIQGQNEDDAEAFKSVKHNISIRDKTSAAVSWSPPEWLTVGVAGADQQTPDISLVVQEIVNRSGWNSGNALVIIITGTGKRTAESFDGGGITEAPTLHIEYSGN